MPLHTFQHIAANQRYDGISCTCKSVYPTGYIISSSVSSGLGYIPSLSPSRIYVGREYPRPGGKFPKYLSFRLTAFASDLMGVGNKIKPGTSLLNAKGRALYNCPLCIIPVRGKAAQNASKPSMSENWAVFNNDVAGSYLPNKPLGFKPQSAIRVFKSLTFSGSRDASTWKGDGEDIGVWSGGDVSDVSEVGAVWMSFFINRYLFFVNFGMPNWGNAPGHSCGF